MKLLRCFVLCFWKKVHSLQSISCRFSPFLRPSPAAQSHLQLQLLQQLVQLSALAHNVSLAFRFWAPRWKAKRRKENGKGFACSCSSHVQIWQIELKNLFSTEFLGLCFCMYFERHTCSKSFRTCWAYDMTRLHCEGPHCVEGHQPKQCFQGNIYNEQSHIAMIHWTFRNPFKPSCTLLRAASGWPISVACSLSLAKRRSPCDSLWQFFRLAFSRSLDSSGCTWDQILCFKKIEQLYCTTHMAFQTKKDELSFPFWRSLCLLSFSSHSFVLGLPALRNLHS